MKRRAQQLASVLKRETQAVIDRGLNDPRISGMITVTEVAVADDLRNATVKVSVYPEERQKATFAGVQAAASHLRREIMRRVHIREMPRLTFKLDESLKKQAEVLALIARANAEREARGATQTPAPPGDEGER